MIFFFKKDSFAYLIWKILKKKLNQNNDANKLNIEVTEFMMIRVWFVIKYEGLLLFIEKKKRTRTRNEEGEKGGRLSGHSLNLSNGFTDKFILSIKYLL